jgi:hypothetical protein
LPSDVTLFTSSDGDAHGDQDADSAIHGYSDAHTYTHGDGYTGSHRDAD